MTLRWTSWGKVPQGTAQPYIDWWKTCPPPEFRHDVGPGRDKKDGYVYFTLPQSAFSSLISMGSLYASTMTMTEGDDLRPIAVALAKLHEDFGGFKVGQGPLPGKASNDDFLGTHGWDAPDAKLEKVDPNTVIVGVIDTGIPLGATRLRGQDGKTRILAAWQQDAAHLPEQNYLPFGRELYKSDIDGMIEKNTVSSKGSHVFQEDSFNAAAGLVDMSDQLANRELAGRVSHGAFVTDLAVGDDPADANPAIKLIAVNLPNRATINNSGIFLDYFTLHGVQRIAQLADQIWKKSVSAAPDPSALKGFPIVINLSFGKNAGAKDGEDYFCRELRAFNDARAEAGYRRVHVVIPVGNHNLEQGNACFDLGPGGADSIGFRVLPEDQSSNYLEIWSDVIANPDLLTESQVPYPFAISVAPPTGDAMELATGGHLQMRSLAEDAQGSPPVARIYSGVRMAKDRSSYRIWHLLCVAPSIQHFGLRQECPSGRWTVTLKNISDQQRRCYLHVQTDQSIRPQSGTGLLPKLERADYQRYTEEGRLRDSYAYPFAHGDNDLETSKVLQRHGSINSTAAAADLITVGGYRRSDGRPAEYSATGWRQDGIPVARDTRASGEWEGRWHPTASFVTDDGYARFGILASGAADGSVVALRGTSFAAAQATRLISSTPEITQRDFNPNRWLEREADKAERRYAHYPGDQPPSAKLGRGRLPWAKRRPVDRFGGL